MDADLVYEKKVRRELHKNATWSIEQILEAKSHKRTAL